MAGDGRHRRHAAVLGQVGQGLGDALQRRAPTAQPGRAAQEAYALAAAQQQGGQGEQQQLRALPLLGHGGTTAPSHGGIGVAPEEDSLGSLPLGLTHEMAV